MPIAEAAAITMAESAIIAGVGWVASPATSKLVNDSISYLGRDIAKELEDLETTLLPQLQLTIEAAQQSPHKARLVKWAASLKNAYYDAEGILHELEYESLKHKAEVEDENLKCKAEVEDENDLVRLFSTSIINPIVENASNLLSKPIVEKASNLLSPQKRELFKRLNKLKEEIAKAETFRNLLGTPNIGGKEDIIYGKSRDVTSSVVPDNNKFVGRKGDLNEIINFLLDKQGGSSLRMSYSVVAITGMGGVGKTTLAQHVCDDERVKENFTVRMWLCLSQNMDIIDRTKEMIECVSGENYTHLRNLSVLQNKLIETLPKSESDNILIILDDVWYDREAEENQWENLLKPFDSRRNQGGTCKIVVTSRSTSFPIALQPGKLIKLRDLAPHDFLSLFRYHAIDDLPISNSQLKNNLSNIVDQIAEKMSKLPLAAKVVGNQLRKRPEIRFWQATLENVNLSNIMEILLWSFYRFDVQLQRCFLFCSVFPKGARFGLHSIVPYWVALDFIQPSNDNRNVEDIALEYFRKMEANSIFQQVDKSYVMHDLFHDLAENLSVEDCFRVTNVEKEIPSTVQHIYLKGENKILEKNLSSICNLNNLRTLILGTGFIEDINVIISKISTNNRNLRVLDIQSRGFKTLPEVVGNFKNLRMLYLGASSIEELSNSVLHLYHLQFLCLPFSVKTLPTNISNFIKLRWIVMYNSNGDLTYTLPPVPYLGKLTSLQHLNEFHVRKEKGYELHQLGCLKEIGGSLSIVNLENVGDKDEAIQARLIDKSKLIKLDLVWAESAEVDGLEIEVIEDLRPPANLESIKIEGYKGSTYPKWFQEGSFIENIKEVMLHNCNALTNLPQFRHCSKLILKNLEALRELPTFPENLVELSIIQCPSLNFIDENEQLLENTDRALGNGNTGANKLKLPSMLRILYLGNCLISVGVLSDCLRGMSTLEELYLLGSSTINALPPAQVLETLQSLRVLKITDCSILTSLGGLHALPHLEILWVEQCQCLEMESGYTLPPTLQFFTILDSKFPQAILNNDLLHLQIVRIIDCQVPMSISFGQLPKLKSLALSSCPNLVDVRGLESCTSINHLQLLLLPNLVVESVSKSWKGCRELGISSSMMLNKLLSSQDFQPPECLCMGYCQEEAISFERSNHLQSIKTLVFYKCITEYLPITLSDFSTLETIKFKDCPKISCLPKLPKSVQYIRISGCDLLRERCQPDGLDWHKIEGIYREIE